MHSLIAAYCVAWGVSMIYIATLLGRQRKLSAAMEQLRRQSREENKAGGRRE